MVFDLADVLIGQARRCRVVGYEPNSPGVFVKDDSLSLSLRQSLSDFLVHELRKGKKIQAFRITSC